MTCGKCGALNQYDAYCSKCGTAVDHSMTECASCLKEVLNSNFCHLCGESLGGRACAHCGSEGQTGKFCRSCGESSLKKPLKKPKGLRAPEVCPLCGDNRLSPALRTDKWVTCLGCFEQFDRISMVDDHCPGCGGDEVFRQRGDGGPFCAHCIQPQVAKS